MSHICFCKISAKARLIARYHEGNEDRASVLRLLGCLCTKFPLTNLSITVWQPSGPFHLRATTAEYHGNSIISPFVPPDQAKIMRDERARERTRPSWTMSGSGLGNSRTSRTSRMKGLSAIRWALCSLRASDLRKAVTYSRIAP